MSLLSGVFGAVSGLINNKQAKDRQKLALDYESAQNKLQREWSEKMYEKQRDDAREDVRKERLYNTPQAQMQRLQAAGLNADLMYGNGASGLVNAAIPSYSGVSTSGGTSNAGVSAIAGTPTVVESMIPSIEAMRTLAETDNIKEDTQKKRGEITSLDIDNFIKAATQGKQIELVDMQVTLAKKTADLSDAQRANLVQSLTNLQTQNEYVNQQIQQSIAQTRNLDSQTLNNRISAYLSGPRFDMEVKHFQQQLKESDARIVVNNAQAKEILTLVLAKKLNMDADTLLKKANVRKTNFDAANSIRNGNILNIQAKQLQFDYNQNLDYNDAERIVNMVSGALGSVGQIATDIMLFKGIGTSAKAVRGFRK